MLNLYRIFYVTKTTAEEVDVVANDPDDALKYLQMFLDETITDFDFVNRAIIKFNSGKLALLCSKCRAIVKEGKDFTHEEMEYALGKIKYVDPLYCDSCRIETKVVSLPINEN